MQSIVYIYSNSYICTEFEDGYFYLGNEKRCEIAEGNLANCLFSYDGIKCQKYKDNYYINLKDILCYSNNLEYGDSFINAS